MDLPEDGTIEELSLALMGGFEAKYITLRDVNFDFFMYEGLYNDEYVMGFINRIIYPLYTFGFSYQNPEDPKTWEFSGGDSVNFTKLVWQFAGREIIDSTEKINKDLVKFYNNAALFSIL